MSKFKCNKKNHFIFYVAYIFVNIEYILYFFMINLVLDSRIFFNFKLSIFCSFF